MFILPTAHINIPTKPQRYFNTARNAMIITKVENVALTKIILKRTIEVTVTATV